MKDCFRANERLKEYSSKVDSYMREKEILADKIKVHDDIGRSLIALKTYLNEDSDDRESLIRLWKNSILLMRGDAEAHKEADGWENLLLAAERLNIGIDIDGKFPEDRGKMDIYIDLLLECLTNTARHAGGNRLFFALREDEGHYYIDIKNNGIQPENEIRKTGGLANIDRSIELAGGRMSIETFPQFVIKARLPKGVV